MEKKHLTVTLFRYILPQSKNPGQAQKEVSHNEALQILDAVVAGAVEEPPRNDPPPSVIAGTSYLVGAAPTGEWSQYADHLATFSSAGWRFVSPTFGMSLLVKSTGTNATYHSTGWDVGVVRASRYLVDELQVIGSRAGPIAEPAGGTTVDSEARATIGEILLALRHHGLIGT